MSINPNGESNVSMDLDLRLTNTRPIGLNARLLSASPAEWFSAR